MFLTSLVVFFIVGREWDALHLYIANNLDWMMVWIEQSQENGHSLTWDGVAFLVKEAHHNGDSNVMPMVVDLVKGLRGGEVRRNLLMIINQCMFRINS